jgi:hypothetical protein
MAINKIKTGSIQDNTVTGDDIQDGAITNAKVNACAAITQSKVSGLATSISNLCSSISSVSSSIGQQANNIALLGFKMAVNDGLTVFNLVDGVVDEFNDESGTDEAEGSNDLYNSTDDYYINSTTPDGSSLNYSAGFTTTGITEPDTSTAGTNPAQGNSSTGTFTVPCGITSVSFVLTGAGGGFLGNAQHGPGSAGGGLTTGNFAVSGGQVLHVGAGEGGTGGPSASERGGGFGGGDGYDCRGGGGGGFSGIFSQPYSVSAPNSAGSLPSPSDVISIGAGGGGASNSGGAGAGGGLTGLSSGGEAQTAQCNSCSTFNGQAGGGDQEQGGQAGTPQGQSGGFLIGGKAGPLGGGGGAGYYGGGGASKSTGAGFYAGGGGGSAYFGHPQISCGATEAGNDNESGAVDHPQYVCGTGEGFDNTPQGTTDPSNGNGEDGYALIVASACATATSTTIVSEPFTSTSVPTSSRIVVFQEDVETPTLNTDIIASVSRDGTNFTTATLSDSGYVTGSSGQRILTGQADISGQPSGQSMRWKLALANNSVKIHGVALQWS